MCRCGIDIHMPLGIGGREGLTVKGALVRFKLYINYAIELKE